MTKKKLIKKFKDLMEEYEQEKKNSPKMNIFTASIHARAQGISEVFDVPEIKYSSEILEVLKELRYFLEWGPENSSHRPFSEIDNLIERLENENA